MSQIMIIQFSAIIIVLAHAFLAISGRTHKSLAINFLSGARVASSLLGPLSVSKGSKSFSNETFKRERDDMIRIPELHLAIILKELAIADDWLSNMTAQFW